MEQTLLPDPSARYAVAGFGGVAFAYVGDETRPDDDTEWTGIEVPTGNVLMVMVGDDRIWSFEPEDCTPLEEADYCPSCGQIGCGAYAS